MKRIIEFFLIAIAILLPVFCAARFGIGLPGVIKDRVETVDQKVEAKKEEKPKPPEPPQPQANRAPVLSNFVPVDGIIEIATSGTTLRCDASDPDSDPMTFDFWFGTDTLATVATGLTVSQYTLPILVASTTYKWQIVATDSKGSVTSSSIFRFTTKVLPTPQANRAPVLSNFVPVDGIIEIATSGTTLRCDASDPDSDPMTFDFLFGTDTLVKIATGITLPQYSLPVLVGSTTYKWQVVATDSKGSVTSSSILKFTTKVLPTPQANRAPVLSNFVPVDGIIEIATSGTTLRCDASDPDSDLMTFDFWFGTDTLATVATGFTVSQYTLPILVASTTYKWQIVATDSKGSVTSSSIFRFTTKVLPTPQANRAPVLSNFVPVDGITEIATSGTTLKCDASDPDGDPMTFDFLFGTDTLVKIATGIALSQYSLPVLVGSTTYKWQVVATDSKGSVTSSSIFRFTTKVLPPPPPNNPPSQINIQYPPLDEYGNPYKGEQGWIEAGGYIRWGNIPITGTESDDGTITPSWTGGDDSDGDPVVYSIYLENMSTNSSGFVLIGTTTEKSFSIWIEKWKAYNLQVVASDDRGSSTSSLMRKFKNGNMDPWPVIDYPKEGNTVPYGSITLKWHGVSLDGDLVKYTVNILNWNLTEYIFHKEGITEECVTTGDILLPNTRYYFEVWAYDGWNGSSGDGGVFFTAFP